MTLKNYLLAMSALTGLCLGIFIFVASLVDPTTTNWLGFLLFYFSLFISLTGLIALIGFLVRFVIWKKELAFNLVSVAFRQSFLLSLFIIILLVLKSWQLFNWLNLFLLIIIFTILELVLVTFKSNR